MKIYNLEVQKRENIGGDLDELRADKKLPGVIYSGDLEKNIYFQVDYQTFLKVFEQSGESSLIKLVVEGEKEPMEVLVKDVQYHPVKEQILHVDLYKIKRGQKIEAEVEFLFEGTAPAEKDLNGVLVKNLNSVSIKCLPKDLLSEIKVDLSVLKTFEDKVTILDLKVPESVEILAEGDEIVVAVSAPKVEEVPTDKPELELPEGAEGSEEASETSEKVEEKPEEKKAE